MPNRHWRRSRQRHRRSPSLEERHYNTRRKRDRSQEREGCGNSPQHRTARTEEHRQPSSSQSKALSNTEEQRDHNRGNVGKRQWQPHSQGNPETCHTDEPKRGDIATPSHVPHCASAPERPQTQPLQVPTAAANASSALPVMNTAFKHANITNTKDRLALVTPRTPTLRFESVEDRRRLTRSHLPSTLSTNDVLTPLLPLPTGDAEAGVLGAGAPLLRPLLPLSGGFSSSLTSSPSPSPSHFALPLSPTVIPFSYDAYVEWLYAAPAEKENSAAATNRANASRRDTEGCAKAITSQGTTSDEGTSRPGTTVGGSSVLTSAVSTLPKTTLVETAPTASAHEGSISVAPAESSFGEIDYGHNFSVSTNWEKLLAAPPLTPSIPALVSLLASKVKEKQVHVSSIEQRDDLSSLYSQVTSSPVLSHKTDSQERNGRSGGGAYGTPLNALLDNTLQQQSDDAEEGLRAFVRNFQHGKVHTRPPWFLCSTLLTNCEHPYYLQWLDELALGSVEEEVALARAAQDGVLGDPSQSQ